MFPDHCTVEVKNPMTFKEMCFMCDKNVKTVMAENLHLYVFTDESVI